MYLVIEAEKIKEELAVFYEKSDLQEKPDLKQVNNLLVSIRESYYSKK